MSDIDCECVRRWRMNALLTPEQQIESLQRLLAEKTTEITSLRAELKTGDERICKALGMKEVSHAEALNVIDGMRAELATANDRLAAAEKAVDMIFRAEHGVNHHTVDGDFSSMAAAIITYAAELREDGWSWHPETKPKVRKHALDAANARLSDCKKGSHMEYEEHRRTQARCAEAEKVSNELERRFRMMAGSNADDYRWYQNAARQAVRSIDTAINAAKARKG